MKTAWTHGFTESFRAVRRSQFVYDLITLLRGLILIVMVILAFGMFWLYGGRFLEAQGFAAIFYGAASLIMFGVACFISFIIGQHTRD